ncbi:ankyrin repeat domain-containing protein 2A-like isoform X2 [Papaver somniferum]|uniref:ankyrin repeat domain-containing protein 2A-like isoform X2 n=1 Tax=Papaver somniferum TaxID=3469 RepID=UPI000E6F6700|nr:ankyrin repeat domain-containing protein 2A-like isoform X2 [Papaver somniferum]
MTCIKEDQYPKAIREANEIGGPAVVMRFLNDPKVLQKMGDGMGFGASGDVVNPTEYRLYSAPYDNAEDRSAKEGTSIVHRTGGVGDTEKEMDRLPNEERVTEGRKMSKNQRKNKRKKLNKRRTALAAQLRANNALYTGRGREECVTPVASGNIAAVPIVEELEIGNLQHDFSADPISTSISEEGLEELMSCVKKDLYLKPIVEDIEIGGPTVMMRYLNDPEVLRKLGQAMGFGLSGEIVDTGKHNAPADYAKSKTAKESDSIVLAGNKGNCRHKDVVN